MAEATGIPSFWDAVAAAQAELDADESGETPVEATSAPAVEDAVLSDQADTDDTEQPEAEVEASIFDDIEVEDVTQAEEPAITDDTEIVIGDGEAVTLRELRDGYLRQSDYTRKTQALSQEREAFAKEQAGLMELAAALRSKPAETIAGLALEAGLISQDQLDPQLLAAAQSKYTIPSAEEVEAEIERRVSERLDNDPRVVAAQEQQLVAQIDSEFQAIEAREGVKLSQSDRNKVMAKAVQMNTPDLSAAFSVLMYEADRRRAAAGALKDTAPTRPTAAGQPAESVDTVKPASTLRELFVQADQGLLE